MAISKLDRTIQPTKITKLFTFRGLERDEAEEVSAGDIVAIAGVEGIQIGESITDLANPAPLEPLLIDEPTLAMVFTINTSPFAGREGQYVTSRNLRARLEKELLTNVSLRVEDTGATDAFRVLGRGELQLAILIETMRREGYELMVGKPEIVVRTENGRRIEPLELLIVDCPEIFIGIVMESLGSRRGEMKKMVNHHSGRVRMEFSIPSRGLIGLRGQLLTDTRGTALIHSLLEGWTDYAGDMAMRLTGALVCDQGRIADLQSPRAESRSRPPCWGNLDAVNAEIVAEAFRQGDPLAAEVLRETVDFLAIWAGNIIDLLEPDIFIFGGGLAQLMSGFFGRIREQLPKWCVNQRCAEMPMVLAKYASDAGIAGAAALCRI